MYYREFFLYPTQSYRLIITRVLSSIDRSIREPISIHSDVGVLNIRAKFSDNSMTDNIEIGFCYCSKMQVEDEDDVLRR